MPRTRQALGPSIRPAGQPHQHLAVRVIDQAFHDAGDANASPANRTSARAFLAGSVMLYYWCDVARLDADCVIRRAGARRAGEPSWTSTTPAGRAGAERQALASSIVRTGPLRPA